jgi:hypothetical protein
MEFTLTTGKQTFPHSSAKVYCLTYPRNAGRTSFPKDTFKENMQARSIEPAARDGDTRLGTWYVSRFDMIDDQLIGLFMTSTLNSRPHGSVGLLLRLRKDAPLVAIKFKLPAAAGARHDTITAFMGNADILTTDQVSELEGSDEYPVPYQFVRRYMDEEEMEEDVIIDVLSKGKPAPKKETLEVVDRRTRKRVKVDVKTGLGRRIRIRR